MSHLLSPFITRKVLAGLLFIAMLFSFSVSPLQAQAQTQTTSTMTTAEMLDLIQVLMLQVAQLQLLLASQQSAGAEGGFVSPGLTLGSTVQTTDILKVRQTPSITGQLLGYQSAGAQGTVVSAAQQADGYTWYKIDYNTGADGWSALNWLRTVSVINTTPPLTTKGCLSGGKTYPVGTQTTKLINADGTSSTVADGYYECQTDGTWKVVSTYPPSTSTIQGCKNGTTISPVGTKTTKLTNADGTSSSIVDGYYECQSDGTWKKVSTYPSLTTKLGHYITYVNGKVTNDLYNVAENVALQDCILYADNRNITDHLKCTWNGKTIYDNGTAALQATIDALTALEDTATSKTIPTVEELQAIISQLLKQQAGYQYALIEPITTKTQKTIGADDVEIGNFYVTFDVTAVDADIEISSSANFVPGKDGIIMYDIKNNGVTVPVTDLQNHSSVISSTAYKSSRGTYYIDEGDTEQFTLEVIMIPNKDGSYRVNIKDYFPVLLSTTAYHARINEADFQTGSLVLKGAAAGTANVSSVAPQKNYFACDRSVLAAGGTYADGKLACYGMWDYGNDFGGDVNMCGSYGAGTVGCPVKTPVCSSGLAIATQYYSNSSLKNNSSMLDVVAANLQVTPDVVKNGVAGLWGYNCFPDGSGTVLGASTNSLQEQISAMRSQLYKLLEQL